MKPIKKLLLLGLFFTFPAFAWAQIGGGVTVGPMLSFISSNKFTSSSGIGLDFGRYVTLSVANRLELMYGLDAYYGLMNISYKSGDTSTVNSSPTGSSSVANYGIKFSLGLNYFLVPRQLSVNLSASASYNSFANIGDDYVIGYQSTGYVNPISVDNVLSNMSTINYGVNIGAVYKFGRHALSLRYDLGLNNFTSGMTDIDYKTLKTVQYNTTFSSLMLSYHYYIYDISLAKTYQNKLLK